MKTIIAALAVLVLGCAGVQQSRWVPCPTGFQIDTHQTWGEFDSDDSGYVSDRDGDYEHLRFGGSVHFGLGQTIDECPVYASQCEGPADRCSAD